MKMLAFLQAQDPKMFYTAVAMLTGGLIYLWRRFSFSTWEAVTRKQPLLQDLPALVLAGLMSAAPAIGKGFIPVLGNILFGILFGGGTAIFGHHALKDSPLPYNGAKPPAAPSATSEKKTPAIGVPVVPPPESK
jgi:hypothetical protein